jgi:hypothetical protein
MFLAGRTAMTLLIHNYRHHDQWSTVIVDFWPFFDLAKRQDKLTIDRSFRSKRKIASHGGGSTRWIQQREKMS